jgi:membrane protein required for colicin V production
MSLNIIDIILATPILLSAWKGYSKGLIIEVTTLAALILGLYFALYFSDFAAGMLTSSFNINKEYLGIISFVATFIGVVILVLAAGKILEKFVNILMLGFLNKLGGAIFGALKGALFLSILIFIVNYFDSGRTIIKKEAAEKSFLYYPVESFAPMLYSHLNLKSLNIDIPEKEEILDEVF